LGGHWKALLLGAALGLSTPASAAEPAFYGVWLIAEARPAPWASQPVPTSTAETRRLIGRKVIYGRLRIAGPPPLACDKPNYEMHDAPLDELFQGGLTEPDRQAMALSFRGRRVATLETGCAGWIDFHFIDGSTALFGLNDMIYTLRKQ
jgi:hypothetical protein